MKKLILFICTLFPAITYSQLNTSLYQGDAGVPHDYLILDGNQQPIKVNDKMDINGTPFLQDKWHYGRIRLANGTLVADSSLNFSLFDEKLYFKRNGNIYPVVFSVKEFSIKDSEDSGAAKTFYFQNGFPDISRHDSLTFYEILYPGNSLKLLKWKHKKFMEIFNYNGGAESKYVPVQEFFVFYPKKNKMVSLGSKISLNDLKKTLPEYSNQIEAYTSAHKLNTGKNEDLFQLFSYLDPAAH